MDSGFNWVKLSVWNNSAPRTKKEKQKKQHYCCFTDGLISTTDYSSTDFRNENTLKREEFSAENGLCLLASYIQNTLLIYYILYILYKTTIQCGKIQCVCFCTIKTDWMSCTI